MEPPPVPPPADKASRTLDPPRVPESNSPPPPPTPAPVDAGWPQPLDAAQIFVAKGGVSTPAGSGPRPWVLTTFGVASFSSPFWLSSSWFPLGTILLFAGWAFTSSAWPSRRGTGPRVFASPLSAAVAAGIAAFVVIALLAVIVDPGGSATVPETAADELSQADRRELSDVMSACVSRVMIDVARSPVVDTASDEALASALRLTLAVCGNDNVPAGFRCNSEGCYPAGGGGGYHWETMVERWLERCWTPSGGVC